jgi:hypothetical protein
MNRLSNNEIQPSVFPPKQPAATLYLVMVMCLYKLGAKEDRRLWPVRIVAFNTDTAMRGALAWAELQTPVGFSAECEKMAYQASVIDIIGSVDCIGESVR